MSHPYYKVVLVGEAGVGKSNLCERYLHDRYHGDRTPTVGSDFAVTRVNCGDREVALHLWDTAGQERFHAMTNRIYVKDADGVIITYDVTNRMSFERVDFWRRMVESCESVRPNLLYILVGNKCDLTEQRSVKTAEALNEANRYSMMFAETSAKTGDNVVQAFHMLVAEIHRQHNETDDYWEDWKHRNRLLTDIAAGEVGHSSCCSH